MAERILVIEDEKTVADIIGINLQLEGFEVELALSGNAGLAIAREAEFDLIICDVMMPDIDGYEICRQLKGEERTKRIPLLLLTARTEVEDMVAGLRAGADDFMTKPFSFPELMNRINMNLQRSVTDQSIIDPLTGMPGNITADDALRNRVLSGEPFAYLLMNINGLKPFRDVYGDRKLEGMILFVAGILKEVVKKQGSRDDLISYLGGGTFAVFTTPECSEKFGTSIVRLFDVGIRNHYTAGDLERGGIITFDRRGNMVDNPLMTISIGAVSNKHRKIQSHWEAAEIAKEVLDYAMTFPRSMYYMDRRKESKKES